ncbi:amino acid aminotransferase [Burkholderia sp. S171]|uniref:amino acid aminotransferase n=1 Tax=Burkholderia sp. S171 TaxID=1641860 RepID=UPI00131B783D|nr:amino acid aminotransferase [Burkholderia sp. S171]
MFSHVKPYAGDPILSLIEKYAADSRFDKVNLGAGIYYDDQGKIPVLSSVRDAAKLVFDGNRPASYLPMEGDPAYCLLVGRLIFGKAAESMKDSLAIVQTVGGSGALKVGADFLRSHFPSSSVYVSDPTWDNHVGIFEGAGFPVRKYRYYDSATKGLDLDGMLADLRKLKPKDVVVLHACCHNPTGVDLEPAQWTSILAVIEELDLIPFVDMAYQGFGSSLDDDAYLVRELSRRRRNFLVSSSFSKNFSMYGERSGALVIHSADPSNIGNVLGQLKLTVRRNYSSPPAHGMLLVSTILADGSLREKWVREVQNMRDRILKMRLLLHAILLERATKHDFDHIIRQRGMFAYTGLDAGQVETLRNGYGIYAVATGRICIAGLNEKNVRYVAESISSVVG